MPRRASCRRSSSRLQPNDGETVSREALLGSAYESDYQELFDLLAK